MPQLNPCIVIAILTFIGLCAFAAFFLNSGGLELIQRLDDALSPRHLRSYPVPTLD